MVYKTLAELIDELTIVNIKVFFLVEKINNDNFEKEDVKKLHKLNIQRSKLKNAINEYFKEDVEIKV